MTDTSEPMSLDTSVTFDDDDDEPSSDDDPLPSDDSNDDEGDTDPDGTSTTKTSADESGTGDETATGDSTGTGGTTGGDPLWCADEALAGALPIEHDSDNFGGTNLMMGSCTDGVNGDEVTFSWTAPADGTYWIDTLGSEIDTVLYVLDGCGGTELACDDDISTEVLTSSLTIDLLMGDTILIVVDGYDGEATGNISLYIDNA